MYQILKCRTYQDEIIKMEIIDIDWDDRLALLQNDSITSSHGFIVAYSITDKKSFLSEIANVKPFHALSGDVYTCGSNAFGELGLGDKRGRTTPVKIYFTP